MVRYVLLFVFLGVCQAAPRLRYTLTVDAGAVHIALAASDIPASARIVHPTHWGNAGNLGNAIRNLRQRSNADLSYDLVQDWQGDLRESVRHRAHITDTYIEFGPPNGLLYPQLPPDQKVSVELDWRLPPNWSLATSFGAEANAGRCIQRFKGPFARVCQCYVRRRRLPFGAPQSARSRGGYRGSRPVPVRGYGLYVGSAEADPP